MHKTMLKLLLALFILGVINPWVGSAVATNTDLKDYYQTCVNKQSQVLPLVKNVQVKIDNARPDHGFTKPTWLESVIDCTTANHVFTALPNQAQNIHYQQYIKLLLYPPHFFG